MKKLLLTILSLAFVIQNAHSQSTFFNKSKRYNQSFTHFNGPMYKSNTIYKPCIQIDYNWDNVSNAWILNDTVTKTYNVFGEITLQLTDGNTFHNKISNYYNANGKQISDTSFDRSGLPYIPSYCDSYTYDSNGNLIKKASKGFAGNTWINFSEDENTYDSNGNVLTYLSYGNWTGSNWSFGVKETYIWSNGQMIEELLQFLDASTNTFLNSSKFDYTYTNAKISSEIAYKWDGITWQNMQKTISLVWYQWLGGNPNNENNKVSSYTIQVPNGSSWKDTTKYDETYDSFGNWTEQHQQRYTTKWITEYRTKNSYIYDANNNITQSINQYWINDSTGFVNQSKTVFSNYIAFVNNGISNINNGKNAFIVYPNPVKYILTIASDITKNESSNISISDITGKVILVEKNIESERIFVNTDILKSGIYFFNLQIESGEMIRGKFIKE